MQLDYVSLYRNHLAMNETSDDLQLNKLLKEKLVIMMVMKVQFSFQFYRLSPPPLPNSVPV